MQYIFAIIAGIIQGATEFIPVSSSGHLILFHNIFNFNLPDDMFFDVMVHLGTFVALALVFWRDLEKIIRGFVSSLFNWNLRNNANQRLAWLVIIGMLPAGIAGFALDKFIENNLRSSLVVAIALIAVAILFLIAEKIAKKMETINELKPANALLIGVAQVLALIPGVSRSGITIIAGLWKNLKREEAARYSFLLSLPVIFGAGMKKLLDLTNWADAQWGIIIIGFLAAAISGYLAVKFLMRYLTKHSLKVFAVYRIVLGLIVIGWIIFFGGK